MTQNCAFTPLVEPSMENYQINGANITTVVDGDSVEENDMDLLVKNPDFCIQNTSFCNQRIINRISTGFFFKNLTFSPGRSHWPHHHALGVLTHEMIYSYYEIINTFYSPD